VRVLDLEIGKVVDTTFLYQSLEPFMSRWVYLSMYVVSLSQKKESNQLHVSTLVLFGKQTTFLYMEKSYTAISRTMQDQEDKGESTNLLINQDHVNVQ
jgi:hypothetical protein